MFKFEIDSEWIKQVQDEMCESVSDLVEQQFRRMANGIIHDAVKSAMIQEISKPEYREKITQIVKEMLLDRDAKAIVEKILGK